MRTFHTVKAEEIVRIDGLNLEYDFRNNNSDAALTPHERILDHDKRRHLATRPVHTAPLNPVNTKEHPENRAGEPLKVVDASGAEVAGDADYKARMTKERERRPGETDEQYKNRMENLPKYDPRDPSSNPFVTDGLPHPAPFKPSWPGTSETAEQRKVRMDKLAADRKRLPDETDDAYKARMAKLTDAEKLDHQRRPNETDEQYDARMHDAAQNLPALIKFTLTGGEIKEVPENELLIGEGVKVPGAGDYLIESYDIWTDKSLFKVYDRRTFDTIFKAGFT